MDMNTSPAYVPFDHGEPNSPSLMVAKQLRDLINSLQPNTTSDVRLPIFKGKTINPRRAKDGEREQWREDIYESLRRAHIPAVELTTAPPTHAQMKMRYPSFDESELELAFETELARFQDVNMRMWDAVRNSIELDGPFESSDKAYIRQHFMNGDIRDSHGLFMWADELGNITDIKSLVKVSKDLANWPELPHTATQDDIVKHASGLLDLWLAVPKNLEEEPSDYYVRLLMSMPLEPMKAPMVSLRNFFAELITKNDDVLNQPRDLIALLYDHADTLGIPSGQRTSDKRLSGPSCLAAHNREKFDMSAHRPNQGKNNCSFCWLDACRALEWANGDKAKIHTECLATYQEPAARHQARERRHELHSPLPLVCGP